MRRKILSTVMVTVMVLALLPIGAQAAQEISVSRGINLYINDHVFIPRDVEGNEVFPFVYNGTTYLPIRAITSALGAEVSFANNTAIITRKENAEINHGVEWREDIQPVANTLTVSTDISVEVDSVPFVPQDVNGNHVPIYVVNGTTYVPVRALCDAFNIPVVWDGWNNRIYLGNHISLVDPGSYADPDYQIKQNYVNLALVSICQWRTDVHILREQYAKYSALAREIVSNAQIVWDTPCYDELEAIYNSMMGTDSNAHDIYVTIYDATDEHIQAEWNNMVNKMNLKDALGANAFRWSVEEVYYNLNKKVVKLNSYCSDAEIEKLRGRMNDIMERYRSGL